MNDESYDIKKSVTTETFVFLGVFILIFGGIGSQMGIVNMINTMLNTAFDLLMNTCFYILAIAVIAGALSGILLEFGVVALINRLLSPLMKPIYGLPGASIISVLTCYLSDNPAILTLTEDKGFCAYFKKYQLPALTNLGTAFGMGMIVTMFMMGLSNSGGEAFVTAALIGNVGAVVGSIVSVRLFMIRSKKVLGDGPVTTDDGTESIDPLKFRRTRKGSILQRTLGALMDGGASGVKVGMSIISGILVMSSMIMLLSNGVGPEGYTGAAYEGIALIPAIADKFKFILSPLFGFSNSECVSIPFAALGSAGAAIGLVPDMVASGIAHANDIAVFTAMCMCWSGYLGTHVAMMNALNCRELTVTAILCHTIGGIAAGVSANLLFQLVMMFL